MPTSRTTSPNRSPILFPQTTVDNLADTLFIPTAEASTSAARLAVVRTGSQPLQRAFREERRQTEWERAAEQWYRRQSERPAWARPDLSLLREAADKIRRTDGKSTLALVGFGLTDLPLKELAACESMDRVEALEIVNNAVEHIDFKDLVNSNLKRLWLSMNRLEELDVSPLRSLQFLSVYENRETLRRIKLGDQNGLTTLYASGNPHLVEIEDLDRAPNLKRFQCMGSGMKTLDLRNNGKLEYICVSHSRHLEKVILHHDAAKPLQESVLVSLLSDLGDMPELRLYNIFLADSEGNETPLIPLEEEDISRHSLVSHFERLFEHKGDRKLLRRLLQEHLPTTFAKSGMGNFANELSRLAGSWKKRRTGGAAANSQARERAMEVTLARTSNAGFDRKPAWTAPEIPERLFSGDACRAKYEKETKAIEAFLGEGGALAQWQGATGKHEASDAIRACLKQQIDLIGDYLNALPEAGAPVPRQPPPSLVLDLNGADLPSLPDGLLKAAPLLAKLTLTRNSDLQADTLLKLVRDPNNAMLVLDTLDLRRLNEKERRVDDYTFYRLVFKMSQSPNKIILDNRDIAPESLQNIIGQFSSCPARLEVASEVSEQNMLPGRVSPTDVHSILTTGTTDEVTIRAGIVAGEAQKRSMRIGILRSIVHDTSPSAQQRDNRSCYLENSARAFSRLLQGSVMEMPGVRSYDSPAKLPLKYQPVHALAGLLPAGTGAFVKAALQGLADHAANKENATLSRLFESSAGRENFGKSMSLALTLLHLDDLDDVEQFDGHDENLKETAKRAGQSIKGYDANETHSQTMIRLLAHGHACKIVAAMSKELATDIRKQTDAARRMDAGADVDHLKLLPALGWHCKNNELGRDSDAFRDRRVWALLNEENGMVEEPSLRRIAIWPESPPELIRRKVAKKFRDAERARRAENDSRRTVPDSVALKDLSDRLTAAEKKGATDLERVQAQIGDYRREVFHEKNERRSLQLEFKDLTVEHGSLKADIDMLSGAAKAARERSARILNALFNGEDATANLRAEVATKADARQIDSALASMQEKLSGAADATEAMQRYMRVVEDTLVAQEAALERAVQLAHQAQRNSEENASRLAQQQRRADRLQHRLRSESAHRGRQLLQQARRLDRVEQNVNLAAADINQNKRASTGLQSRLTAVGRFMAQAVSIQARYTRPDSDRHVETALFSLEQLSELLLPFLAVCKNDHLSWDEGGNILVHLPSETSEPVPLQQFLQQRHDPSKPGYTIKDDLRPCLAALGIATTHPAFGIVVEGAQELIEARTAGDGEQARRA